MFEKSAMFVKIQQMFANGSSCVNDGARRGSHRRPCCAAADWAALVGRVRARLPPRERSARVGHERAAGGVPADLQGGDGRRALLARARGSARGQRLRAQVARSLVERFDIEPFSDFSAK